MRPVRKTPFAAEALASMSKRQLLKFGLAGSAALLLPACGSGDDEPTTTEAADPPQAGPWLLDGETPDASIGSQVPFGDSYDALLDPNRLIDGTITGYIESDQATPVAVSAYTHDGDLIGQAMSDAQGYFSIHGQARSGMRIVARTGAAELSAYEIGREWVHDEPIYVNALTTLTDRLRRHTGWRYSQAEDRLQDLLQLDRGYPIQMTLHNHPDFALAQFEAAAQALGLSIDALIDHLVAQAASDEYADHLVEFDAPRRQSRLSVDPAGVASFLLDKLKNYLNGHLSDEEKEELFGGLLVKLGVFSTTSQMERNIQLLCEQVAIVVGDVNALLKKVNKAELNRVVSPVNDIIRTCLDISNDMRQAQTYTNAQDYALRVLAIRKKIDEDLGSSPYAITQLFIGHPAQLGEGNTVMDALMETLQLSEVTHFYGKSAEQLFTRYVDALRTFQSYLFSLKVMNLLSRKYLSGETIDETYVTELCHAAAQYDKLFAQLAVTPLPHEQLYLDQRSGYAWWADHSLAQSHGTWRGTGDLINAASRLPAEIRGISDTAWEAPSRADLETPFFKESKRRALSFKSYITSFGGPANGFYDVSGISKAPKFNIWLQDTFLSSDSYASGIRVWIFYYAQRAYARPAERDFRKSGSSSCESSERGCSRQDFGDYGNYKNYFYPVNKHVRNVEQYYPWVVFRKLRQTYKNFDHLTIIGMP